MFPRFKPVVALVAAFATIAGCSAPTPFIQLTRAGTADGSRPLVGYLEHRGRLYAISDLLDPEFRAASEVDFVGDFDPDTVYADCRVFGRLPRSVLQFSAIGD